MNFTDQQNAVVNYNGEILVVEAGAGSGKTSVLKGFARANPKARMLYICFNKPIQLEAEASFPKNVVCRTGHAIAFARKGKPLMKKLTANLRMTDVKSFLKIKKWELVTDSIRVFNNFLVSDHTQITIKNAIGLPTSTSKQKEWAQHAVSNAKKIWAASIDPRNPFPCVHDVYMKLYCLDNPELHKWFSYILLDEAQDSNPVLSGFVARQKCRKIIVGDNHQQLYRFRGADNAMKKFVDYYNADVATINQSFRFGPKIADVASRVLKHKSEVTGCKPFKVTGNETISDTIHLDLPANLTKNQFTILHRTVSGTIGTALDNQQKKIHWIGGIENYKMQELLDVYYFSVGEKEKIRRKKLMVEFSSFFEYEDVADASGDLEMKRIIKMIEKHGSKLPRAVQLLRSNECKEETKAHIIIGTAHRSKGLEWDVVRMANDYPDILDPTIEYDEGQLSDELNLLYVACTRAIVHLEPCSVIHGILEKIPSTNKFKKALTGLIRPESSGKPKQRVKLED